MYYYYYKRVTETYGTMKHAIVMSATGRYWYCRYWSYKHVSCWGLSAI